MHPIDLWTYDHLGRMPVFRSLADDLAKGPETAADAFVRISQARLDLVVEDGRDRGLGEVPALVEGPQSFPSMVSADVGSAVWLVAGGEQTRKAREEGWPESMIRPAVRDRRACLRETRFSLSAFGTRQQPRSRRWSRCLPIRSGKRPWRRPWVNCPGCSRALS